MPPPTDDTRDPLYPAVDDDEQLQVSTPSEGVYVFHTQNEEEFIRIDIVVDPVKLR